MVGALGSGAGFADSILSYVICGDKLQSTHKTSSMMFFFFHTKPRLYLKKKNNKTACSHDIALLLGIRTKQAHHPERSEMQQFFEKKKKEKGNCSRASLII